MAVMKYIKDFASYTTMHGFKRIFDSKATPKRIAWIIVFATAWIIFTIQMSFVLRGYFEYPKMLTTDIVFGGVPFPAITLCNLGSFDFYTVHKLSQGLPLLQHTYGDDAVRKGTSREKNNLYLNDTFIRAIYQYYRVINDSTTLSEMDSKVYYDKLFSRTTLAANIPTEMLSTNGYQENEFIVNCTYKNKPCKFKKIFDPYFFNCYTFTAPNVRSTDDDNLPPLLEGIENGISVMLLAGTRMLKEVSNPDFKGMPGIHSKDSALSGAGGVRVVIHPPGTKPFPLTEGYDIPPGQMAGLSLAPKKRERLGQPHGHCNDMFPSLNEEEKMLASPYRKTACEKVCIQKEIYKECKCYENTLPTELDLLPDDDDDDDSVYSKNTMRAKTTRKANATRLQKFCFSEEYLVGKRKVGDKDACKEIEKCSGTNEFHKCFKFYSSDVPKCSDRILKNLLEKIKCADEVKNRVMANATLLYDCGCHPSCKEVLYDVAYSLSQWPSQGIDGDTVGDEIIREGKYIERFSSELKKEFYENYTTQDIKRALKDFSKINVYVSDASVFLTKEEPAMTPTQLVSGIGGQLGVWIGVSVLTIAEVLEVFVLVIMDCCRKKCRKEKHNKVDSDFTRLVTADNSV